MAIESLVKCGMPCSTMGIIFGYPILDNNSNEAFVKMYFKSHVNVRRNILAYSATNLWAEVGGYIGLLLGFSLLDLTKLVKNISMKPSMSFFARTKIETHPFTPKT